MLDIWQAFACKAKCGCIYFNVPLLNQDCKKCIFIPWKNIQKSSIHCAQRQQNGKTKKTKCKSYCCMSFSNVFDEIINLNTKRGFPGNHFKPLKEIC